MAYKKEYRDSIIMDNEMKHDWNCIRKDLKNHPEKIMDHCKNPVEVQKRPKETKHTRIGHAVRIDKA